MLADSLNAQNLAIIAAGFLTLYITYTRTRHATRLKANGLRFPAGPKGYPIIGNLFDIPQEHQWLTFASWKKSYGDVVGLSIFGKPIIVLNSRHAIKELLVKRSAIYSDRPKLIMLRQWAGWDWCLPMLGYGEEMHQQRKLMNACLNATSIRQYHALMTKETRDFCVRLLKDPKKHLELNRRMAGANILKMTYGYSIAEENDSYVDKIEQLSVKMTPLGAAGSHPVDLFPALANLPPFLFGKKFAAIVTEVKQIMDELLVVPYHETLSQMATGSHIPSLLSELVESHRQGDGSVKNERAIQAATAITYIAGADTTVSSLDTFILAMMSYPEVQQKAQRVMDDYLRGTRLPEYSDRDSLPYIEAVILETFRWKPVAPLALPHFLMQDDEYNGYLFPAGSLIFSNSWQCFNDDEDYPEPSKFNPDRFMNTEGTAINPDVLNPREIAFGFGRRICPGRHMADASLWISIATLLTTFNMSKPVDENGHVIEPDLEYECGPAVSHPKPFKCDFVPRSQVAIDLLHASTKEGA
ncbi:cytochrome P450 [Sistotremastrum suecicum HHB10207 ss-3]|uniref:Cytochrome P450 n=1 Tax=Sistotremastrum suecicum HHB10207 ss-3 TaxID=1314776 RepID=A0A166GH57_9AGAM|nr:cytochrome P450 [Sistotremastrum suecicum HHB10207 ss-3]